MPDGGDGVHRVAGHLEDELVGGRGEGSFQPFAGVGQIHLVGAGDQQQHRIVIEQVQPGQGDGADVDAERAGGLGRGGGPIRVGDDDAVVATGDQGVRDPAGDRRK